MKFGKFRLELVEVDPEKVIILDLVKAVPEPAYCTHGRVQCYYCRQWCWLGEQTYKAMMEQSPTPSCLPCAKVTLDADSPVLGLYDDTRPEHE